MKEKNKHNKEKSQLNTTTSQNETLQQRATNDTSRQIAKNSTSLLNLPSFDTTKQTTSDSSRRIKLNHMV